LNNDGFNLISIKSRLKTDGHDEALGFFCRYILNIKMVAFIPSRPISVRIFSRHNKYKFNK